MRPTPGLRLLAAFVGGILVVAGQVVGFIGLLFLGSGESSATVVGLVIEALALGAVIGGLLVAAKVACNPRPVRASLIAVIVVAVGIVVSIVARSSVFDLFGSLGAIAVAILLIDADPDGQEDGQYPTATR